LSDDDFRALQERAQRYRRYGLEAARLAMDAPPELKAPYLRLAQHWAKLAESLEREMKRTG
jgi:hypothetical protein